MKNSLKNALTFIKYVLLALLFPTVYTAVNLVVSAVVGSILVFGEVFSKMSPEELNGYDIYSNTELADTAQQIINKNMHAILIFSGLVMLFILLLAFRSRGTLSERVKMSPVRPAAAGMSALCGLSFYFLIILAMGLMVASSPELQKMGEDFSEMMSPLMEGNLTLKVIALVIMAPIIEEVIFRGLTYNYLRRVSPVWAAVLLQSMIFAASHISSYQVIYVLMLAPVLALLYEWTGSLLPPILAHMAFNGASVVMSHAGDSAQGFIQFGLLLVPIAIFTLVYFSRNRITAEKR